jgi:predicted DNA-binding mobile mystery protein A
MSTRQLGERLDISQQSAAELEQAERTGSITLKNLERIARAMNAELYYAIVPCESFEKVVEDQAALRAGDVVERVETSMSLEGQGGDNAALKERKRDLIDAYVRASPRDLWDRK